MTHQRIAFPGMEWMAGSHPLERKKNLPESPAAMIRFAPGFADPNWCGRAHVGLVLSGTLTMEFEEGAESYREGEAFVLTAGTRHRAANRGPDEVTVFIYSEG
jgi:quercetin dioxygenase-like cupin family protein